MAGGGTGLDLSVLLSHNLGMKLPVFKSFLAHLELMPAASGLLLAWLQPFAFSERILSPTTQAAQGQENLFSPRNHGNTELAPSRLHSFSSPMGKMSLRVILCLLWGHTTMMSGRGGVESRLPNDAHSWIYFWMFTVPWIPTKYSLR